MNTTLKDKVAIITGTAEGMGKVIVEKFSKECATVILIDFNADLLEDFAKKLVASGVTYKTHIYNISNPSEVKIIEIV